MPKEQLLGLHVHTHVYTHVYTHTYSTPFHTSVYTKIRISGHEMSPSCTWKKDFGEKDLDSRQAENITKEGPVHVSVTECWTKNWACAAEQGPVNSNRLKLEHGLSGVHLFLAPCPLSGDWQLSVQHAAC